MKLISAIIESYKLEAVQEAIGNLGFSLTATDVKGFGRQKGHTELYRGIEYSVVSWSTESFGLPSRQ